MDGRSNVKYWPLLFKVKYIEMLNKKHLMVRYFPWALLTVWNLLHSRFESFYLTGALGSFAWRNLERINKLPAVPLATYTLSLLPTTTAPAPFRWPPYRDRRQPQQPPPTGTWTCTSATTRWPQITLHSHRAPTRVWCCAALAAPPSMTSTRNRHGCCCWSSFRKFPRSWRKCST